MWYTYYHESDAIANLCVACLSLLGGLGIIAGYFLTGQRHIRKQLILGLGITDCFFAANVVIGNAHALAGGSLSGSGCTASSFFYQALTVMASAWTLLIALVTYVTLCHPLGRFTRALERRRAIWYCALFALACGLAPAIVGTAVFDQVDNGGVCWYPLASLQSKLMVFVPRAFTFTCVIAIYARLILFFARRDTSLLDMTTESDSEERQSSMLRMPNLIHRPNSDALSQLVGSRRPSKNDSLALDSETAAVAPSPTDSEFPTVVRQAAPTPGVFLNPFTNDNPLETVYASRAAEDDLSDNLNDSQTRRPSRPDMPTHSSHDKSVRRSEKLKVKKPLSSRALNRRLSLLMCLYPLAYLVLFSVSVARLADSIAHPTKRQDKRLIIASRLMVFSQGLVDGLIFALIEYLFRRSMNR